ncbi:hypothetical protein [Microbacterium sp. NPDC057650]|uniref:hypothetical protein n=1 Tax=unclassified Microbacterium TaxID=2609290 RepID=UPI0036731072
MTDVNDGSAPIGSLSGIDLDPRLESAYRTIVAIGPTDSATLPTRLDGSAAMAQTLIADLAAARLIDIHADGRVEAVSPALAFGSELARREQQIREARAALDSLSDQYRSAREQTASDGIEIVRGRDEIGSWLTHLLLSGREQFRLFAKPPFAVFGLAETDTEREIAGRRLRERVIIERTVLDEPAAEKDLLASLDRGQEIRMMQSLPAKLLIVDDAAAIVQLDDGGMEHSAIAVVRPGGLLDCLTFSFESLWRSAMQLREGPGGTVDSSLASPNDLADPADREVLALLLAGHTDAAVASRLGIGLRTVQRRVRHLMDLAGTDSRVLLGWHARDRGWL